MIKYNCPRCGYNNNDKTKYIKHLKRKNICKNIFSDNNLEEEYKLYDIDKMILYPKIYPKNPHFEEKEREISSKNTPKIPLKVEYNRCDYCTKIFSSYKNLWRHQKICKDRIKTEEANDSMNELVIILNKQIEDQKKEIESQKEEFKKELEKKELELEKRNNQIDELIKKAGIHNNNITTNIQNNIKLLAYQDTDISKITDNDIISCINHNNMCVPQLIKMIHFDPKKPENHNIYISNLKNGYIMLYDGKKWNTFNRDEMINNMIDEKQTIIEEKIEDWITKGKEYPELMKKFERYLNKKENNEVLDKIKSEIKLMLYNSRNLLNNIN